MKIQKKMKKKYRFNCLHQKQIKNGQHNNMSMNTSVYKARYYKNKC